MQLHSGQASRGVSVTVRLPHGRSRWRAGRKARAVLCLFFEQLLGCGMMESGCCVVRWTTRGIGRLFFLRAFGSWQPSVSGERQLVDCVASLCLLHHGLRVRVCVRREERDVLRRVLLPTSLSRWKNTYSRCVTRLTPRVSVGRAGRRTAFFCCVTAAAIRSGATWVRHRRWCSQSGRVHRDLAIM